MSFALKQYQRDGVLHIEHNEGGLLADEQGLGKTIQGLWWLRRNPQIRPAVVVCPASLKWVWEREALHHAGIPATVLHGRKRYDTGLIPLTGIVILNYDILPGWMEFLFDLDPGAVLLDEAQNVAHRGAKRSILCRELCHRVGKVLAMSGTPLTNKPAELWSILNMVDPVRWPDFFPFAVEYCNPELKYGKWNYDGARNLDKLHAELKGADGRGIMIRRLKADVLKELPDKTQSIVPLDMRDAGEYHRASTEFLKWLGGISPAKAKRAARVQGLVKVGYLKRLAAKLKMRAALDWVQNFLETTDEKIVLFGWHEPCIAAAMKRFGHIAVKLTGSTPQGERRRAVDAFQNDPRVRVFVGNIQAAGTGLTLTAAATVAFLELDWRPAAIAQAMDRVHRIGQHFPTFIYYLVAVGSIEEILCRVLQRKQGVVSAVLDGGAVDEDFALYDELIDELEKMGRAPVKPQRPGGRHNATVA